jgi:hypothetical protein
LKEKVDFEFCFFFQNFQISASCFQQSSQQYRMDTQFFLTVILFYFLVCSQIWLYHHLMDLTSNWANTTSQKLEN